MNDGRRCVHAAIDWAALHTVFSVLHCFLIGTLCNGNALNANGITRSVHHDEHVFKTPVFLADQIADGAAVITILKHSGRAGLDAHLVFNADTVNIVASAEATIRIDHELGHNKQADTLHAFRRALHTSQHQVHDVVSHVVLTIGDVNFCAKNFEGAIRQRLGACAHQCQIGAGLGLRQIHGARPLTRN